MNYYRDLALSMSKENFIWRCGTITHISKSMPEWMAIEHNWDDYYPELVVRRQFSRVEILYRNVVLYGSYDGNIFYINHLGMFNYSNTVGSSRAVYTREQVCNPAF
jgi:hypothetical protein